MMKQYIKPNMQVEMMEVTSTICVGSPRISDNGGTPQADTNGNMPKGDASQALAKEYPHFDAWAGWDDELPN